MYDYVRTYRTARAVFATLEVVCYVVLAIAAIALLLGLANLNSPGGLIAVLAVLAVLAAVVLGFLALLAIAMTQVSRAVVDSAETSREMLEIARASARVAPPPRQASPATVGAGEPLEDPAVGGASFAPARRLAMKYGQHEIYQEGWIFTTSKIDKVFTSLLEAQAAIDNLARS